MLQLIQIGLEQHKQASTNDAIDVDKQCFVKYAQPPHVPLLVPGDNSWQANSLLPHINNSPFDPARPLLSTVTLGIRRTNFYVIAAKTFCIFQLIYYIGNS